MQAGIQIFLKEEFSNDLQDRFCDFWKGFDKEDNYFINTLRKIYGKENVVISSNPDSHRMKFFAPMFSLYRFCERCSGYLNNLLHRFSSGNSA